MAPPEDTDFEAWEVDLHGHRAVYRAAGSGPPVVLIHGMVNSSRHWREVALRLAGRYTVIAPDLIGHGDSATPRGDYSLGAHAAAIRDLLVAIGVEPATWSATRWAAASRCSTSGSSPSGSSDWRSSPAAGSAPRSARCSAAPPCPAPRRRFARPTAERTLSWLVAGRRGARSEGLREGDLRPRRGPGDAAAPGAAAGAARSSQTLRAVIDAHGQRVSAVDRLYLLGPVPTLIVWGERDNTIPIAHGMAAVEAIPDSRFESLPRAAHFPHLEDPEGLAAVLGGFIAGTHPHSIDEAEWAELIAARTVRRRHLRAA